MRHNAVTRDIDALNASHRAIPTLIVLPSRDQGFTFGPHTCPCPRGLCEIVSSGLGVTHFRYRNHTKISLRLRGKRHLTPPLTVTNSTLSPRRRFRNHVHTDCPGYRGRQAENYLRLRLLNNASETCIRGVSSCLSAVGPTSVFLLFSSLARASAITIGHVENFPSRALSVRVRR